MIPKIIHQTAYANKDEWHPIWKHCQQSTLKHFKNFEYKFWDDDSLDNFVKEKYPQIYEEYKNFKCHIFQLDCVRYLLLHYYGGIYIDMDVYCYDNFYDELKKHYSLDEIVELGTFIGMNIGYHTFYGTLDFYPMFSPDGRLIDQEESRKIYGTEVKSLTGRGQNVKS